MDFTLTPQTAEVLLGFLASVFVPFVVNLLVTRTTDSRLKLAIAALLSLAGGLLSEFAAGHLSGGSVAVAAIGVFMASQAHFSSWFSGLGLDDATITLGRS